MLRLVLALLCLGLLAGACGGDEAKPQVSFSAGGATVAAAPVQYCNQRDTQECANDPAAVVKLAVAPGTAVQVSVPEPVKQAPWHVVFTYLTATGERIDARGPVIPAGQRSEFTLTLPAPTDQLVRAEVQQFAAGLVAEPGGEVSFPISATWALVVAGT
ncbi:MAG: DUF2771 family protein [Pseudonocardiales bacterium]|nr:DUF2771 family protein [Pseudonocardiales bacterium]